MIPGFSALVRLFWDICCFKRGPEDVPYSPVLLSLVAVCQWGLVFLVWTSSRNWRYGSIAASVYLLAFLALPYLVLTIARKTPRYLQMEVSLLSTSFLINIVAILVIVSLGSLTQIIAALQYVVLFSAVLIVIWMVAVQGAIYQHTLEKSRFMGICIAIFVLVISSNLLEGVMRLLGWARSSMS